MLPDPTILAFDTSAPHCAAALLYAGQFHVRVDEMARGQAEHLIPMLEAVLAARGLALGLGIPAVGVSNFEAAAYGTACPVDVVIPAPRDQAYLQRLTVNGTEPPHLLGPNDPRPTGALLPPPAPPPFMSAPPTRHPRATRRR